MTATGCARFDELCAVVASGAATPQEQRALDAHLADGCPACAQACRSLSAVAAALASVPPPIPPTPAMRERLLAAVERDARVSAARGSRERAAAAPSTRARWVLVTGWAVAAGLGVLVIRQDLDRDRAVARYHTELAALRVALADAEDALRVVNARDTMPVALAGLEPSPHAFGRVFWNPSANAGLLVTFDLPGLPAGKVYQLWAIQDATPVDAGVFSLDRHGVGALKVKALPEPTKTVKIFAITIEPAGGSAQPTGNMVLKGETKSL
ncbi:MAG: anti-sigma factor [Nitrospirota bacterium]